MGKTPFGVETPLGLKVRLLKWSLRLSFDSKFFFEVPESLESLDRSCCSVSFSVVLVLIFLLTLSLACPIQLLME